MPAVKKIQHGWRISLREEHMDVDENIMPTNLSTWQRIRALSFKEKLAAFPWWLLVLFGLVGLTIILISVNSTFAEAFSIIRAGLSVTISTTASAYLIAICLGLIAGLGRISERVVTRNLATAYVELVRGVPLLVLIFFIALVLVPGITNAISALGIIFIEWGLESLGNSMASVDIRSMPMNIRAIIALATTYGAFLAEVFRAGIQSVGKGQMEAARSQGMTYGQAMRYVILPQAIRNVMPALGNDFISMLKDSSLVSVLAVRDITQIARLYTGHSFHFQEAYMTLSVLYLSMTLVLSLFVKMLERRYGQNDE